MKFYSFQILVLLGLIFLKVNSSEACDKDTDCIELNHCNFKENKCEHDRIFIDIPKEMIGLFTIMIGSALSNAGGIGGGGLLIPILLLILNFYTHEAIPISKLMIFTGALTSFILGFRQKHPTRNSISIDYNIPLLLVPMLLFGTMVGVTLNKVTPPWIILVSLTAVLIINTYKTLKKGKSLYKSENERIALSNGIEFKNLAAYEERSSINDNSNKNNNVFGEKTNNFNTKDYSDSPDMIYNEAKIAAKTDELLKIEEIKDLVKLPLDKIWIMGLCYIVMLAVNFIKGTEHVDSFIGVKLCSLNYWIIYSSFLPFAILVTYLVSIKIKKEYLYRQSIGYPYNNTDIKWDNTKIFIKFPIFSFISGMLAGLLGIGGGLILGPLLLELGIHPIVSTATSNFLVLFTSSSTSIQFILLGMMNRDFGIACTIASSIGSFIGTILIQKLINKTKRNSYLVIVLGAVLGVSTILIPIHTLMQLIEKINEGKSIWSFSNPC